MAKVSRTALVPYSPSQMYALVNDIPAYPDFLPWCSAARIVESGEDYIVASVEIAYSGIRQAFTTRNTLQEGEKIHMRLLEGPFRFLDGHWQFHSLGGEGCKVTLDLEFEFSSRLMSLTFGKMFNKIATTLIDAFVKRAQDVYG